jgi:hypothetical protein
LGGGGGVEGVGFGGVNFGGDGGVDRARQGRYTKGGQRDARVVTHLIKYDHFVTRTVGVRAVVRTVGPTMA